MDGYQVCASSLRIPCKCLVGAALRRLPAGRTALRKGRGDTRIAEPPANIPRYHPLKPADKERRGPHAKLDKHAPRLDTTFRANQLRKMPRFDGLPAGRRLLVRGIAGPAARARARIGRLPLPFVSRRKDAHDPNERAGRCISEKEFRSRRFCRRMVMALLPALFKHRVIHHARDNPAQNRRHPEQPQLLHRPAAHKHRRPRAARRIHGKIRHRNAN